MRIGIGLRLALLLILIGTPAQASLGAIVILPPNPTVGDSLLVDVHGTLPDGCWSVRGTPEFRVVGPELLLVDIYTFQRLGVCDFAVQYYELSCNFGRLPAGTYTLIVTEHRISPWFREPEWRTVPITITGSTPVRNLTWGLLKSRYP